MADSPSAGSSGRVSPAASPSGCGQAPAGDARREPIRYSAVAVTTVKEKGGIYAKPKDRATGTAAPRTAALPAAATPGRPTPPSVVGGSSAPVASASMGKAAGVAALLSQDVTGSGRLPDSAALHSSFREVPPRDLDVSVFNAEYNVSLDGRWRSASASAALQPPTSPMMGAGPAQPSEAALQQQLQLLTLANGVNGVAYSAPASAAARVRTSPPLSLLLPATSVVASAAPSSSGSAEAGWTADATASAYERLALEKANLEGRVETLVDEAEAALRERQQLQAELAAAHLQLAEQQQQLAAAASARPAGSAAEGDQHSRQRLLQEHEQLEVRAAELQASADASLAEARRLAGDLLLANAGGDRLREAAEAALADAAAQERLVGELRASAEAARAEARGHDERRQRVEDEARRALDELGVLASARDWYQQQLHSAQETRAQLQSELTKLQNHASAQTDVLERLLVESAQLKQQLSETQRKALTEKQLLMRHLEAIEADMVEREAGIDQIQREQNLTELTARQRLAQAEKERVQLGKLAAHGSELERELQRARHELAAARAEVDVLDGQRAELGRRLVASQEELAVRCHELERLREVAMEMESRLKTVFKKDTEKDAQILRIKEERDNIEVALRSALEEKKAFSSAVEALKGNAAKVEANFKLIRQELAAKTREFEQAVETSARLQRELATAATSAAATLSAEQLEVVRASATLPLLGALARTQEQPLPVPAAEALQQLEHDDDGSGLAVKLAALSVKLTLSQQREQQAVTDRLALERHCAAMAQEHAAQLEQASREASTARAELEGQLREVCDQLDAATERHLADRSADDALRKVFDDLRAEAAARTAELEVAQRSALEQHTAYQGAVALLSQQLKEAVESRDRAFRELMSAASHEQSRASVTATVEQLLAQIKLLQADLSEAQKRKAELEQQLMTARAVSDELQRRAAALERHLAESVGRSDEQQRRLADGYQQLLLELEKERGRLAGVRQHHDKLKQHARELEVALARRESSAEPSGEGEAAQRRQVALTEELEQQRAKVHELDAALQRQRGATGDLRAQLMQESDNSVKLKQQLDAARSELLQLRREAERRSGELLALAAELERAKQAEDRLVAGVQVLQSECRSGRLEADQLRRAAAEAAARAPIVNDEIKALHWQIKQKSKEVNDLENRLQLTERRLQLETDNMKKALTMSNTDTETLRLELAATRKEKFSYQAKVGELRGTLKAVVQQVKASSNESSLDVENFEKLIEDTAVPSYKSKPLQNLKSCLVSLQTEMQVLQQQMTVVPEQPETPTVQDRAAAAQQQQRRAETS